MTLVSLVIALIVIGVALWLVNTITMDQKVKVIINAILVVAVCLWLLSTFGIINVGTLRLR